VAASAFGSGGSINVLPKFLTRVTESGVRKTPGMAQGQSPGSGPVCLKRKHFCHDKHKK